jgi:ribosomal protein S25
MVYVAAVLEKAHVELGLLEIWIRKLKEENIAITIHPEFELKIYCKVVVFSCIL